MISFNCPTCGKVFKIPDAYAGRKAKCKLCGGEVIVPETGVRTEDGGSRLEDRAATADAPPRDPLSSIVDPRSLPGAVKIPMRTRRLKADAEMMQTAFGNSPIIAVTPLAGDPPEAYRVTYRINSLEAGPEGEPVPRGEHEIEIQLTSDYPRLSPKCKILTPIFHPNFDKTTICVADHWTAGERLVDLVIRIGEMIAYQAYNIQSPLDGEAAMWADLNREKLPTDAREMRPAELE